MTAWWRWGIVGTLGVVITGCGIFGHPNPHRRAFNTTMPSAQTAKTVDFVTPQQGWLGGRNALWMTHNFGLSWHRQWTGPGTVDQISMISAAQGWALVHRGRSATFLVTTDGGRHWQARSAPKAAARFQALTDSIAYAANARPMEFRPASQPTFHLWLTTTAGRIWQRITGPSVPGGLVAFHFFNQQVGWVVTMRTQSKHSSLPLASAVLPDQLWKTTNAGRTWHAVELPQFPSVLSGTATIFTLWALTPNTLWMAAQAPSAGGSGTTPLLYIYQTTNGGYHWTPVVSGMPGRIQAVSAHGATAAVLTGCAECSATPYGVETFWSSQNGGAHWQAQRVPMPDLPSTLRASLSVESRHGSIWAWLVATGHFFVLSPSAGTGLSQWQYLGWR